MKNSRFILLPVVLGKEALALPGLAIVDGQRLGFAIFFGVT